MRSVYCVAIFIGFLFLSSCSYYFGNSWRIKPGKQKLETVENILLSLPEPDTANFILKTWAAKDIPDWKTEGKVSAPRVMLAKLLAGRDIDSVNKYLTGKTPWGKNGTDWAFNPHGDYDFSEVPLVTILYLFGDKPNVLYPAAKESLLNRLLTHSGNKLHLHSPGTLGILNETENHIFMGETSRYLKNQWLREHGDTSLLNNNAVNGLDEWWMACLNQKLERGFFEFNANPYSGYSLTALLTFYTFCHQPALRAKCGELLNDVFNRYAYSSLSLRRYPPFRRRMERQKIEKFADDPVTSIVQTLLQKKNVTPGFGEGRTHLQHSLLALISNYQIPNNTVDLLKGKKNDYFIKTGHRYRSCPEIYSGSPDYLLSAGGAQRGKISQISVHPIVLFLNDSARELNECFYLPGRGKTSRWNMTGVYSRFACANHPVVIPAAYKPVYESNGWKAFKPYANKNFYVLVYNTDKFGMLLVFPDGSKSPEELLGKLVEENKDSDLRKEITIPFQEPVKLQYDVNAPKRKWIIKSINGQLQDRKTDIWPY